ncbi:MAG: roadblock/LC7 domain-containing protein [Cyanobacteria bacterium P01_D01_bin.36]
MSIDIHQLNDAVRDFVTGTLHVQGAALVTAEGLPMVSTLPPGLEEPRAAAMAAAVVGIGDRIGAELQRGDMQHILLEGANGYSILTSCTSDTLFLVLASREAKQGVLMLEIKRMIAQLAQFLG